MTDPVALILSRLHAVKPTGPHQWSALCPAHGDRRPSLSIAKGEAGIALMHCHAGCPTPAVLAALKLDLASLFPQNRRAIRHLELWRQRSLDRTLPPWVFDDPAWPRMTHASRWLLYVMARSCYRVLTPAGAVGYVALDKQTLRDACLSRATAWRSANALVGGGFLVKVNQGGCLRETGRHVATFFAVPGRRGELDSVAVPLDARGEVAPFALAPASMPEKGVSK